MLSSGFTNAPISKAFLFGLILSSILASITDNKHYFYIQIVPHLWPYKQAWRMLIWQTCYTNSTELLFATMTVYHMRIIERLWGSSKYASFLFTIYPITAFLPPFLLAIVLRPLSFNSINYLPAGPTTLVFALLAQYHAAIPHVYKYRIATSSSSTTATSTDGLSFSDKSMTYLLAGQLALSQLPGSLVAAAVGWGVGLMWRNEVAFPERMTSWRLPGWVVGGKREGEGFEGLRRRLEGEGRASGVQGREGEDGTRQRRGIGRAILDQFRGAF